MASRQRVGLGGWWIFYVFRIPLFPLFLKGWAKDRKCKVQHQVSTLPYVRRISTAASAAGAGSGVHAWSSLARPLPHLSTPQSPHLLPIPTCLLTIRSVVACVSSIIWIHLFYLFLNQLQWDRNVEDLTPPVCRAGIGRRALELRGPGGGFV